MKTVKYQPSRMNTVNPYLMVKSVQELIRFIKEVFNGEVESKLERPDLLDKLCTLK